MPSQAMKDSDRMPFGQHKGKRLDEVPAKYLDWLSGEDWLDKTWPALAAYIRIHRKQIDWELDRGDM